VTKPGVSNLLTLYALATGTSVSEAEQEFSGGGYGPLKGAVSDAVIAMVDPIRLKTLDLLDDPAELDRLLAVGAHKAEAIAEQTLKRVYDSIGFLKPAHLEGGLL
jgi:tryptophanyl-tRNA synthetase